MLVICCPTLCVLSILSHCTFNKQPIKASFLTLIYMFTARFWIQLRYKIWSTAPRLHCIVISICLHLCPPSPSIPLSSPQDEVSIRVFSSSLRSPMGEWMLSYLPPPPHHHLIIIHLGGRISTAWDIRPITQSRRATGPGPPTLPLLSRRAPIYWKGQCA